MFERAAILRTCLQKYDKCSAICSRSLSRRPGRPRQPTTRRGVRPLWQKSDGHSQCRARFGKSQTDIHNVGTALAKAGRTFAMSVPLFRFPSRFSKRQTTSEVSGQLCENPVGNLKSGLTFAKVVRLS